MLTLLLWTGVLGQPWPQRVTVRDGQTVTPLSDLEFQDFTSSNSKVWAGGAVHIDSPNQANVSIEKCMFVSIWNGFNSEEQTSEERLLGGGAIYTNQVDLYCDSCEFLKCKAISGFGGAICCREHSAAEIISCNFSACTCSPTEGAFGVGGGGAVYVMELTLTCTDCNFTACECPNENSAHHGGAILAIGDLICSGCCFEADATTTGNGGAIFCNGTGSNTIIDCSFTDCSAKNAGAVYYDGASTCNITNCTIDECYGKEATASCLYLNVTDLTFDGVYVSAGRCSRTMIQIDSITNLNVHLTECHINGGEGTQFEGGYQCIIFPSSYTKVSIVDSSFKNIRKASNGGGVFRFSGNAEIVFANCCFENNSVKCSTCNGGALSFPVGNANTVMITDCIFRNCQTEGTGGAVYASFAEAGTCTIRNCKFTENQATKGQSLQFDVNSDRITSQYVISDCLFSKHQGVSPLCLASSSSRQFSETVKLSSLNFTDNMVDENGLASVFAQNILYDSCYFQNNRGSAKGILLLATGECLECHFSLCVFDNCKGNDGNSMFYVTGSVSELIFTDCQFVNCPTGTTASILNTIGCQNVTFEQGSISLSSGRLLLIDPNTLSLVLSDVYFENCDYGSMNGMISSDQNAADVEVSIEHCTFVNCGTAGTKRGMIYASAGRTINQLSISDCNFTNDDQKLRSTILQIDGESVNILSLEANNYTSVSDSRCLSLSFKDELYFADNVFTLCVTNDIGIALTFPVAYKSHKIDRCTFDNQEKMITGSSFVDIGHVNTDLTFTDCVFQNISSTRPGTGVHIPVGNEWSRVKLANCNFTNLVTQADGGAVFAGSVEALYIEHCVFSACERVKPFASGPKNGAGGLYISEKTSKAEITYCVFSHNESPSNGGSLQVIRSGNAPFTKIKVSNCEFMQHETGPILCFARCDDDNCKALQKIDELKISTCIFTDNKLDSQYGILQALLINYVYENCQFINNINQGNGIIALDNDATTSCVIRHCQFDNTQVKDEDQMRSVIQLNDQREVSVLELYSCLFKGMRTTASLFAHRYQQSSRSNVMNICHCTFTNCYSSNGIFLNVNSRSFLVKDNDFSFDSQFPLASPISIQVNSADSKVEDSRFAVEGRNLWGPLVTVSFAADVTISFYNCCFTNPDNVPTAIQNTKYYLRISQRGTAKLSAVCFDMAQSRALEVSSEASIVYSPSQEYFFEDCECWVAPSVPVETTTAPEPTPKPPVPPIEPTSTTDPTHIPPHVTTSNPDPESGSGGKSNAGMIAGVTVGVLVVIVVILIIVILVLRRRNHQPSREESSTAEELTEEDMSQIKDDHATTRFAGDWSHATEDNPMFSTESADGGVNAFDNRFEEDWLV